MSERSTKEWLQARSGALRSFLQARYGLGWRTTVVRRLGLSRLPHMPWANDAKVFDWRLPYTFEAVEAHAFEVRFRGGFTGIPFERNRVARLERILGGLDLVSWAPVRENHAGSGPMRENHARRPDLTLLRVIKSHWPWKKQHRKEYIPRASDVLGPVNQRLTEVAQGMSNPSLKPDGECAIDRLLRDPVLRCDNLAQVAPPSASGTEAPYGGPGDGLDSLSAPRAEQKTPRGESWVQLTLPL